jgi:hypothetical protein
MNKKSNDIGPMLNILGILSPIVGVPLAIIIHEVFDFKDHTHGFTSLFMVLEIILYFCVTGLLFSIISFVRRERLIVIGIVAFIINAAPTIFLLMES